MSEPLYTDFELQNIASGVVQQTGSGEIVERYVYGVLYEMSKKYEARIAESEAKLWVPVTGTASTYRDRRGNQMIDWIIGTMNMPMRDLNSLQVLFLVAAVLALTWGGVMLSNLADKWRKL